MRILFDTHTLIWHFEGNALLSRSAKSIIDAPENQLFISAVSIWEVSTKVSLDKLRISSSVHEMIHVYLKRDVTLLPMTPEHAMAVQTLPWHHRDPFDRMLITQALQEKMTLLTHDELIRQYDVPQLW